MGRWGFFFFLNFLMIFVKSQENVIDTRILMDDDTFENLMTEIETYYSSNLSLNFVSVFDATMATWDKIVANVSFDSWSERDGELFAQYFSWMKFLCNWGFQTLSTSLSETMYHSYLSRVSSLISSPSLSSPLSSLQHQQFTLPLVENINLVSSLFAFGRPEPQLLTLYSSPTFDQNFSLFLQVRTVDQLANNATVLVNSIKFPPLKNSTLQRLSETLCLTYFPSTTPANTLRRLQYVVVSFKLEKQFPLLSGVPLVSLPLVSVSLISHCGTTVVLDDLLSPLTNLPSNSTSLTLRFTPLPERSASFPFQFPFASSSQDVSADLNQSCLFFDEEQFMWSSQEIKNFYPGDGVTSPTDTDGKLKCYVPRVSSLFAPGYVVPPATAANNKNYLLYCLIGLVVISLMIFLLSIAAHFFYRKNDASLLSTYLSNRKICSQLRRHFMKKKSFHQKKLHQNIFIQNLSIFRQIFRYYKNNTPSSPKPLLSLPSNPPLPHLPPAISYCVKHISTELAALSADPRTLLQNETLVRAIVRARRKRRQDLIDASSRAAKILRNESDTHPANDTAAIAARFASKMGSSRLGNTGGASFKGSIKATSPGNGTISKVANKIANTASIPLFSTHDVFFFSDKILMRKIFHITSISEGIEYWFALGSHGRRHAIDHQLYEIFASKYSILLCDTVSLLQQHLETSNNTCVTTNFYNLVKEKKYEMAYDYLLPFAISACHFMGDIKNVSVVLCSLWNEQTSAVDIISQNNSCEQRERGALSAKETASNLRKKKVDAIQKVFANCSRARHIPQSFVYFFELEERKGEGGDGDAGEFGRGAEGGEETGRDATVSPLHAISLSFNFRGLRLDCFFWSREAMEKLERIANQFVFVRDRSHQEYQKLGDLFLDDDEMTVGSLHIRNIVLNKLLRRGHGLRKGEERKGEEREEIGELGDGEETRETEEEGVEGKGIFEKDELNKFLKDFDEGEINNLQQEIFDAARVLRRLTTNASNNNSFADANSMMSSLIGRCEHCDRLGTNRCEQCDQVNCGGSRNSSLREYSINFDESPLSLPSSPSPVPPSETLALLRKRYSNSVKNPNSSGAFNFNWVQVSRANTANLSSEAATVRFGRANSVCVASETGVRFSHREGGSGEDGPPNNRIHRLNSVIGTSCMTSAVSGNDGASAIDTLPSRETEVAPQETPHNEETYNVAANIPLETETAPGNIPLETAIYATNANSAITVVVNSNVTNFPTETANSERETVANIVETVRSVETANSPPLSANTVEGASSPSDTIVFVPDTANTMAEISQRLSALVQAANTANETANAASELARATGETANLGNETASAANEMIIHVGESHLSSAMGCKDGIDSKSVLRGVTRVRIMGEERRGEVMPSRSRIGSTHSSAITDKGTYISGGGKGQGRKNRVLNRDFDDEIFDEKKNYDKKKENLTESVKPKKKFSLHEASNFWFYEDNEDDKGVDVYLSELIRLSDICLPEELMQCEILRWIKGVVTLYFPSKTLALYKNASRSISNSGIQNSGVVYTLGGKKEDEIQGEEKRESERRVGEKREEERIGEERREEREEGEELYEFWNENRADGEGLVISVSCELGIGDGFIEFAAEDSVNFDAIPHFLRPCFMIRKVESSIYFLSKNIQLVRVIDPTETSTIIFENSISNTGHSVYSSFTPDLTAEISARRRLRTVMKQGKMDIKNYPKKLLGHSRAVSTREFTAENPVPVEEGEAMETGRPRTHCRSRSAFENTPGVRTLDMSESCLNESQFAANASRLALEEIWWQRRPSYVLGSETANDNNISTMDLANSTNTIGDMSRHVRVRSLLQIMIPPNSVSASNSVTMKSPRSMTPLEGETSVNPSANAPLLSPLATFHQKLSMFFSSVRQKLMKLRERSVDFDEEEDKKIETAKDLARANETAIFNPGMIKENGNVVRATIALLQRCVLNASPIANAANEDEMRDREDVRLATISVRSLYFYSQSFLRLFARLFVSHHPLLASFVKNFTESRLLTISLYACLLALHSFFSYLLLYAISSSWGTALLFPPATVFSPSTPSEQDDANKIALASIFQSIKNFSSLPNFEDVVADEASRSQQYFYQNSYYQIGISVRAFLVALLSLLLSYALTRLFFSIFKRRTPYISELQFLFRMEPLLVGRVERSRLPQDRLVSDIDRDRWFARTLTYAHNGFIVSFFGVALVLMIIFLSYFFLDWQILLIKDFFISIFIFFLLTLFCLPFLISFYKAVIVYSAVRFSLPFFLLRKFKHLQIHINNRPNESYEYIQSVIFDH